MTTATPVFLSCARTVDGERRFGDVGDLPAALRSGDFLFADVALFAGNLVGPDIEDQRPVRSAAGCRKINHEDERQTESGTAHGVWLSLRLSGSTVASILSFFTGGGTGRRIREGGKEWGRQKGRPNGFVENLRRITKDGADDATGRSAEFLFFFPLLQSIIVAVAHGWAGSLPHHQRPVHGISQERRRRLVRPTTPATRETNHAALPAAERSNEGPGCGLPSSCSPPGPSP